MGVCVFVRVVEQTVWERERERLFKLGWVWEREGECFCASEIERERCGPKDE